jgi:hypothetical protein
MLLQGKVRSQPKAELSDASRKALLKRWTKVVTPVTGHATYEDLHAAVRKELGNGMAVEQ